MLCYGAEVPAVGPDAAVSLPDPISRGCVVVMPQCLGVLLESMVGVI